ncbi:MAG: hypothetical protein RLY70_4853, partial [Planctomycetota bacterium]
LASALVGLTLLLGVALWLSKPDSAVLLKSPPPAAVPETAAKAAAVPGRAGDSDLAAHAKNHWAYHPPRRPDIPTTPHHSWTRSPLDRLWIVNRSPARPPREGTPREAPPKQAPPEQAPPNQATPNQATPNQVTPNQATPNQAPPNQVTPNGALEPPAIKWRDAEPRVVARRLALALTGLPIRRDLLHEFLADERSGDRPDAVERLVDRLIGSPAFGERLASPWLDLARYADTHGYHADSQREMWRWRDWVVDAFNQGKAYDEFLVEQLAGDLLPHASLDQQLATGFLRNHMIIWENGVFDEEYRVEYVMDRVATFSTVVLGQTLACARCHDHKHDPFSQADFYRLFAYFNNVPEKGVDGEHGNAAPVIVAPTAGQRDLLARLDARIAATQQTMDETLAARDTGRADPAQTAWEKTAQPGGAATPRDPWLRLDFAGDDPASSPANRVDPATEVRAQGTPSSLAGPRGAALLLDGESWLEIPPPKRESTGGWAVGALIFPTVDAPLTIASRIATFAPRRGWSLRLEQRRLTLRVYGPNEGQVTAVQATVPIPLRQWRSVGVTLGPRASDTPVRLFVDGRPVASQMWRLRENPMEDVSDGDRVPPTDQLSRLEEAFRATSTLRIGRQGDEEMFRGGLDEFWMFDRPLAADEMLTLGGVDPLAEWLAVPQAKRSRALLLAIRRRFLAASDPQFRDAETQLRETLADRERLRRSLPSAMVMRELPEPRPAFVLHRGRFDEPRERLAPDVPRWMTPGFTEPVRDRLALARWATRDGHPLTARVAVNRFYRDLFGEPLVATPDDFGFHGAAPDNPRLLDWLACEFQGAPSSGRSRWDVKRLHRLMATSSVFRRRGPLSADTALPAETVRDQTLALAGLLDRRLGGPGVFPPQPDGLWEELAYDTQQFTAQTYRVSDGGDRYRRALYTFWKRAAPPPTLAAFDAPDREVCVAARPSSHSPQQALILMNEPQWLDAARQLARLVASEATRPVPAALAALFEEVLARPPSAGELRTLEQSYAAELALFLADPAAAAELLNEPVSRDGAEQAARAALACAAHVLLSLEETVTLP